LELRVPERPPNTPTDALLEALSELRPVAAGFLWTFILSSIFWYLHSRQFQRILRVVRIPAMVITQSGHRDRRFRAS